jgi:hypothetical protein
MRINCALNQAKEAIHEITCIDIGYMSEKRRATGAQLLISANYSYLVSRSLNLNIKIFSAILTSMLRESPKISFNISSSTTL